MFGHVLIGLSAHAYPLSDHRALTAAAVSAVGLDAHARPIVCGAVWEDLDLVAKWTRWSHYDKPTGEVRGRRRRSGERVDQLWTHVERDLGRARERRTWRRVGRIVHHVQDMAVPAHVVPIQHGPADGFERFDHLIPPVGVVSATPPSEAHAAVARDTWTALAGTADVCGREVPWADLWITRDGRFGTYGALRFGAGEDCGAFAAFDADRSRAALVGSASVLAYVAGILATRTPLGS